MHRMHRLILIFFVLALAATQPAVAQFEVAPEHFDQSAKAQTAQSAREEQKLRESIAEERAILESYATRVAEKEQQVEGLRQAAIAAGIIGDGAGMEIAFSAMRSRNCWYCGHHWPQSRNFRAKCWQDCTTTWI